MKSQNSICLICKNRCFYCSHLLHKKVYHIYCYQRILKKIENLDTEIFYVDKKIVLLKQILQKSKSFGSSFKRKVLLIDENLGSLQPRIEYLNRDLKELNNSKEIYEKIIKNLYDYWPLVPPDWPERCRQTVKRRKKCYSCARRSVALSVCHKVPISKGGSHKLENLILLCEKCSASYTSQKYKAKRIHYYSLPN